MAHTAQQFKDAFAAMTRTQTLSDAQANALAAQDAINPATFQNFIVSTSQNAAVQQSTGAIALIWGDITGLTPPDNATLTAQVALIQSLINAASAAGLTQQQALVRGYTGMGSSLANSAFNGSFASTFNQDTNALTGQQAFVSAAFSLVFGTAPTAAQLAANVTAFQAIKTYYANTPVPETTTDARAKGDFLANLKLQAQQANQGPEIQQETFFIQNLGNGNAAVLGTSLSSQPNPFPVASVFLTIGVDTPTSGFSLNPSGTPVLNGFTATAAGTIFNAQPAGNPPAGTTNTLNAGDNLLATGAAAGNSSLLYTAVASGANPAFANAVTMNGVSTATITNTTAATLAGFAGSITGLVNVAASSAGGAIQLGTAGQGLNTALAQITLQSNEVFTAWMTAAALGGAADAVTVNLTGVGTAAVAAVANLNVTSGTNGYETVTVNSIGTGPNFLVLNTNATSTATIVETGAQNLNLAGTALNIANLHTYNGSAGTGAQIVIFNGTGNVAATGGSNNDIFVFDNGGAGPTTFTSASRVDGGGTMMNGVNNNVNELELDANTGALLGAGVGPNIVNIQVVEHRSSTPMTGDLTVDASRLGSAPELDLAATYQNGAIFHNVTVSNLTNAQTVLYEGAGLGNLTLMHAPGGLVNVVNFTMAADAESPGGAGPIFLGLLTVGPGLAAVNIQSLGIAADNIITNVNNVADSVAITGSTHLTFGGLTAPMGAYLFLGGTIDASLDTGGVEAAINTVSPSNTTHLNTFIGGPGNDIVHLGTEVFHGAIVDFSRGGKDLVDFHEARFDGDGLLTNVGGPELYNSVVGWTTANDTIQLTNSASLTGAGAVFSTNGVVVPGGAASAILIFTTNSTINASGLADNWIDITTPISGAGQTAAQGLASAIGAIGSIQVNGGHAYLISYYDLTDQQAVFAAINSNENGSPNFITAGDATNLGTSVIGFVHMSQADYAALTTANLHF